MELAWRGSLLFLTVCHDGMDEVFFPFPSARRWKGGDGTVAGAPLLSGVEKGRKKNPPFPSFFPFRREGGGESH